MQLASGSRSRVRPAGLLLALAAGTAVACHDGSSGGGGRGSAEFEMVAHWSTIAVDGSGLDHAPSNQGPPHAFGENLGPGRAARAMAIVHIAVFEAVNAIDPRYESYVGLPPVTARTSLRAAIGQAAHDTLVALFPSQAAIFDGYLAEDLAKVPSGAARTRGIALGQAAAQAILAMRTLDGSEIPEPVIGVDYVPDNAPGVWRQDPISLNPLALGAFWGQVTPFVMASADQFRVAPPPALTSAEYTFAYDEARVLGGDGIVTPTARTEEQTFIGNYWAYDGTPSLCAPPRLYNQLTVQLAGEQGLDVVELARLLALVNVALADTGIACWESKYHYALWRPVTAIRESDPGTGPTGLGDGNASTLGDPAWTPLGAPASNQSGPNFTPPFPSYPSGHGSFGGALFQVLRRTFGTDEMPFTFVSDEYNGVTLDENGLLRPLEPRSFDTFSEAEEENGQSRIYLGIHWRFDKTEAIAQGRQVGDLVFDTVFQPLP